MLSAAPENDSHYNTDGLLNVGNYADGADWNPYVVGSTGYNIAHNLPQPSPWEDEAGSGPPEQGAGESMTTTAVQSQQTAAPVVDLSSLLLPAAIIAVLWAISG